MAYLYVQFNKDFHNWMWLTVNCCNYQLNCRIGIVNPPTNMWSIEQYWCDWGLIKPPPLVEIFWSKAEQDHGLVNETSQCSFKTENKAQYLTYSLQRTIFIAKYFFSSICFALKTWPKPPLPRNTMESNSAVNLLRLSIEETKMWLWKRVTGKR